MGGGGGDPGSPGTVVQQTAPWAAMAAGNMGAQAAFTASQQASSAIKDAIGQMNGLYINAAKTIQPYTQQGVQALDKLNSYLQLNPYNPGTAPIKPTVENLAAKMTSGQVRDYAMQNMSLGTQPGSEVSGAHYTGYGTQGAGPNDWWSNIGNVPTNQQSYIPATEQLFADPNVKNLARLGAANEALPGALDQFNIQNENWNQANDLYNQYTASGPMTQQQISDSITNQPGYQAELGQGIDAINKASSARGYLGSGRVLKELNQFGQNTLSKYYGNQLSMLAGMASQGQNAATNQAGLYGQQAGGLASLYSSLGENQANATLAGANAVAQGLTAANQQFNVIGQRSPSGGGGGLSGLGSVLGGVSSLMGAFG